MLFLLPREPRAKRRRNQLILACIRVLLVTAEEAVQAGIFAALSALSSPGDQPIR